jgi:hypothetical protein
VHEHIRAAFSRGDEAEALLGIEELHDAVLTRAALDRSAVKPATTAAATFIEPTTRTEAVTIAAAATAAEATAATATAEAIAATAAAEATAAAATAEAIAATAAAAEATTAAATAEAIAATAAAAEATTAATAAEAITAAATAEATTAATAAAAKATAAATEPITRCHFTPPAEITGRHAEPVARTIAKSTATLVEAAPIATIIEATIPEIPVPATATTETTILHSIVLSRGIPPQTPASRSAAAVRTPSRSVRSFLAIRQRPSRA